MYDMVLFRWAIESVQVKHVTCTSGLQLVRLGYCLIKKGDSYVRKGFE